MTSVIMFFMFGLLCLIKGGDWFVDSSVEIARQSGLSQIFIGATIVSLATTLPEVIVSSTAAIQGETTMSIGNAVGSIICNTGLILAITAVFGKITISDVQFKFKSITLISYILILASCSLDGKIVKSETFILMSLLIIYLFFNLKSVNNNKKIKVLNKAAEDNCKNLKSIVFFFITGISLIIFGSNLVVKYGVILAQYLKVPTAVISLTLIALGTSLPELVTGVSSLIKGNEEIGLGNIIGANILNATLVTGISGLFSELIIIPQNITLDIPVALLVTLVLIIPSMFTKKVTKIQGLFLFSIYASYIVYLWQKVL